MHKIFLRLHERFSTKTKTIVLVLALFIFSSFVFVYLRFLDTKNFTNESQRFFVERVQSVYTEILKRTEFFYLNRGYANLNSFGVTSALKAKNSSSLKTSTEFRWNVLKKENPHLLTMAFYDEKGKLITYLGENTLPSININSAMHGFWLDPKFIYRMIVPWESIGFIAFDIDPRFFLTEISELIGLEGLIFTNKEELVLLKNGNIKTIFRASLGSNETIKDEFFADGFFYKTHTVLQETLDNKDFKFYFFQNITPYKERLSHAIYENATIVMILAIVIFLAMHFGFEVLIRRIEELNATLEKRVAKEIEKRVVNERLTKEKEQMLIHQSKLASMGEMIGNIAHQWRQPLTHLGAILIGLELLFERGKLTTKNLQERIKEAQIQIKFMSETIDDFRNFFATEKKMASFDINKAIQNSTFLMDSALKNNNIKCEFIHSGELFAYGYENEVSQVLLNIIANAKDILLEREIKKPFIKIESYEEDDFIIIKVCDNGGGIKTNPIEKIFEPYFSTKHASSGAGIGLYMSKIIIEKNSFGKLNVSNSDLGACFTISLPTP